MKWEKYNFPDWQKEKKLPCPTFSVQLSCNANEGIIYLKIEKKYQELAHLFSAKFKIKLPILCERLIKKSVLCVNHTAAGWTRCMISKSSSLNLTERSIVKTFLWTFAWAMQKNYFVTLENWEPVRRTRVERWQMRWKSTSGVRGAESEGRV